MSYPLRSLSVRASTTTTATTYLFPLKTSVSSRPMLKLLVKLSQAFARVLVKSSSREVLIRRTTLRCKSWTKTNIILFAKQVPWDNTLNSHDSMANRMLTANVNIIKVNGVSLRKFHFWNTYYYSVVIWAILKNIYNVNIQIFYK